MFIRKRLIELLLCIFTLSISLCVFADQLVPNQKVMSTTKVRSFNCAAFSCENQFVSNGTTGTTTANISDDVGTNNDWILIQWDNGVVGWAFNPNNATDYYTVFIDDKPNVSNISLPSSTNGSKIFFSGFATDDWNIRKVGMIVNGKEIFSHDVSGKSIDFSSFYFYPTNPIYGAGNGTYTVIAWAEDINTTSNQKLYVTVNTSPPPNNPPSLSNVALPSSSDGSKIFFSGFATDDQGISKVGMSVDGRRAFEQDVSGQSVNFASFWFDPNNSIYGHGDGYYSVVVWAIDNAGKETDKPFYVTVSTTPPPNTPPNLSNITLPSASTAGVVYFSGSATDDKGIATVGMTVDGKRAFEEATNGTVINFSKYWFDSNNSIYGRGNGTYTVVIYANDNSGVRTDKSFNITVNVPADKTAIQKKIDALEKSKASDLKLAQESFVKLSPQQQAVIDYKAEYLKNLTEQNSALGFPIQSNDLKPNDPVIGEELCSYNKSSNQSLCYVNNPTQTGSLIIRSQKIVVDYANLTSSTYPVIVRGESTVDEQLLTGAGSLSTGSWSSREINTPYYIANNQQQLKTIINYMLNNKSSWASYIDNGFKEQLKSMAAAAEVSDYSVFNIDREKEMILDGLEQAFADANFSADQIDKIMPIVEDTIVSAIPYVGNGKSIIETFKGQNLITLEPLSGTDRVLNVAYIIVPQVKILRSMKKLDAMGIDSSKVKALILAGNRIRGLKAATYLKNHPELIIAGLSGCIDHVDGIPNKGVKGAKRYPDVICNGINFIESKVGRMYATKRLKAQLQKDIDIVKADSEITIYWVSTKSSSTEKFGFSEELTNMVVNAGLSGRIKFISKDVIIDL